MIFLGVAKGDNNWNIMWFDSVYNITYPSLSGSEGGGNLIHLNYDVQSTPTAILISPDRKILEKYIWPPTRKNLNDAILAAGGIMVGTEENITQEKESIILFPNPSVSNTSFSFNSSGGVYHTEIISLTGSIVHQTELIYYPEGKNTIELKTDHLKAGIYFVRLKSRDSIILTGKLIKR